MPIRTTCPHCDTVYSLDDNLRGKKVRCKNCGNVIAVGGAAGPRSAKEDEAAGKQERVQAGTPRPKVTSVEAEEEPARRKHPNRADDDSPKPRRQSRSNRGLLIGLGVGCLALGLLVVGGITLVLIIGYRLRDKAKDFAVDVSGPWPPVRAVRGLRENMPDENTVILHIARVADESTREAITSKLKAMSDPGGRQTISAASAGDRMTVLLFPVRNPEVLATKIDFGTVRGVEGRVITVVARKVDQPPPAPRVAVPGDAKDDRPEGRVYLSELPEIDPGPFPAPMWHFGKNGDVGNGSKIKVDGNESPKGLGMHPPGDGKACRVQYRLDGKAETLEATVAISESFWKPASDVVFEVFGDGKSLWKSKPINRGKTDHCKIDLTGVVVLELQTKCGAPTGCHAVWLDPFLNMKETAERKP